MGTRSPSPVRSPLVAISLRLALHFLPTEKHKCTLAVVRVTWMCLLRGGLCKCRHPLGGCLDTNLTLPEMFCLITVPNADTRGVIVKYSANVDGIVLRASLCIPTGKSGLGAGRGSFLLLWQ